MKSLLTVLALSLVVGSAQAATYCSIFTSGDNSKTIYVGEPNQNKLLVINKDQTAVVEADFTKFTSLEQWKALDKQQYVLFTKQASGDVSIVLGQVDISNTSNIMPIKAAAFGALGAKSPVVLMAPTQGLSLGCANSN